MPDALRIPALTPLGRSTWLDDAGRLAGPGPGPWRTLVPLGPATSVEVSAVVGGPVLLVARHDGRRVRVPVLRTVDAAERSQPSAVLRVLADALERHRAGGARVAAALLRAQADHVEALAAGLPSSSGPVPTAGARALHVPAFAREPGPDVAVGAPETDGTAVILRVPGTGPEVARLDPAAGTLATDGRRPVRLDGRATATVTAWRRRVSLRVSGPLRATRACVPLLDLRPGHEATTSPASLRALADALATHRVRAATTVVPQLRAQAAHLEAGGPLPVSPLAAHTRGGDGVLAALPDL